MHRMLLAAAAAAAAAALAGCGTLDVSPLPRSQAVDAADRHAAESARLHVQLVRSFDRMEVEPVAKLLDDPNPAVRRAAAAALGRWNVRRDAAAAEAAVAALSARPLGELPPDEAFARVSAMAAVLANRAGLEGDAPSPPRLADLLASGTALRDDLLASLAAVRAPGGRAELDGPGWDDPLPPAPPRPGRVERYVQPIHTVPVVAQGLVLLGDVTGDGALDYIVLDMPDVGGTAAPVSLRITCYDHFGQMLSSVPLVGDDRPAAWPSGRLPDLNGDGTAELIYGDRGGRLVVRDSAGNLLSRTEPLKTLDGQSYFPAGAALHLANLRGAGPVDLVLALGPHVLALSDRFNPLWHVKLGFVAEDEAPTVPVDLDGDGRDEILHRNVCIGSDGRVRWTLPRAVADTAVLRGPGAPGTIAVMSGGGGLTGCDAGGVLWRSDNATGTDLLAGRFIRSRPEPLVVAAGDSQTIAPQMLGRLGSVPTLDLARSSGQELAIHPAGLVSDWDRDGIDEAWATDGAKTEAGRTVYGWFKLPHGPAAERIAFDGQLVGAEDVDNDGREELLYFQGKSLVIHRR